MRILHVVPTYLPATRYGGPIYSVHGLCKALAARGHEVHVFTTDVDGSSVSDVPLEQAVDLDGVQIWYFGTGLGRRLYRSPLMARALDQRIDAFDILHLHSVFLWPTTFAARLAQRRQIPYVLTPRGMLVGDLIRKKSWLLKTSWIELFERANVRGAAALHLTAEVEAVEIRKLGFKPSRVDIIPNGVDMPPEELDEQCEKRLRVLSLGRVNWKKGLDRLIAAMAYVPQAELVIAGNDEEGYCERLEVCAKEAGVGDRILFQGPVHGAAKWRLLRSCHVFAMASYSENFGVAALEAMACGRPVVVTPQVGLAQSVRETGAGVVADGAPEMFGRALLTLLNDAETRERMGRAGAKAAAERFSWARVSERIENVYQECLNVPSSC
ncbi:glycosyltransferase [Methylocystis sp. WRRC1]|uniref:glycosyltransferase n=1 Tax=Methylocystis sp. WRRC1 TaxID=1732014 RepID=UPI001D147ECA|nr:glycosyltransferase [Methylocystis sp. WRRC1]MCC3244457.1 glycosyltransferase [Methylocystis sp. WRRC1]